jgi:DNA-binding MarR family transcriptional regulator/GNAT superfamily N-acetyltransferase
MTSSTASGKTALNGSVTGDARVSDGYLSYLLSRAGHVVYQDFYAVVHAAGLSTPEWRVLAALSAGDGATIGDLAQEVLAQQPTLTKLVQRMEKAGWVQRGADTSDARRTLVLETAQGQAAVAALLRQAKQHESALLAGISPREVLILKKVLRTLINRNGQPAGADNPAAAPGTPIVALRDPRPGDMGWVIQQHGEIYAREYGFNAEFEAMVADIVARYLRKFQPEWERCWIAELNGQRVGSVFVVRKSQQVAQLRMLILTQEARGLGLGLRLTRECIDFARGKAYKKMQLWTNSCLDAARAIYAQCGFKLIKSEPYEGFGQEAVGETWELSL